MSSRMSIIRIEREEEGVLDEGNMCKLIKSSAQRNSEGIHVAKCPEVSGEKQGGR